MSKPGRPMYEAARWRAARARRAPSAVLSVVGAVEDYEAWARATNRTVVTPRRFRNAMNASGFVERAGPGGLPVFVDIDLKGSDEGSDRSVTKVTIERRSSADFRTRDTRAFAGRSALALAKVTFVTGQSLISHLFFARRTKGFGGESDESDDLLGKVPYARARTCGGFASS